MGWLTLISSQKKQQLERFKLEINAFDKPAIVKKHAAYLSICI
jgi:hypothetical protein